MKHLKTVCLFLGLSLSTLASAERFEGENRLLADAKKGSKGVRDQLTYEYCKIGDFPQALYWMERNARHPDEHQLFYQRKVANAYAMGSCDPYGSKEQIYPPNYHKAIQWYQRVVFSGKTTYNSVLAKFDLAEIYFWGKGDIAKDGQLAKRYYRELANISDSLIQNAEDTLEGGLTIRKTRGNARLRLSKMYYFGDFMRQDFQEAYHWAKKGWQDKNYYAGVIVATLQYEGKGTEQNRELAKELIGDICDEYAYQQACDWYQDMRDNRPLRKGSI